MGVAVRIASVFGFEALDSRGTPTAACVVRLENGAEAVVHVPSGASTGTHEAHERRDGGKRYGGRGVRDAVASLNGEIAAALRGHDAADQASLDELLIGLDGTPDLSRLGGNSVLAASLGCALAAAAGRGVALWRALAPDGPPLLPLPMVNVLSGGAHAGGLVDIQDVLVVPVGAATFAEAIEWAWRARAGTAEELRAWGHDTALVADEGGLAAPLATNRDAIEVVLRGIDRAGLITGKEAALALDVAATQLLAADGRYHLRSESRVVTATELVDEIVEWCEAYPIVSVEDPLAEDDPLWVEATKALAGRQVLGDDLFVTSPERFAVGCTTGIANAVLVKPNQCGTLSRACEVVEAARAAGYATVVSARSGDTEDAWPADLAVGWRAGQIKVGSLVRSERTAKWNRLLRIEAEHPDAVFAGPSQLARR